MNEIEDLKRWKEALLDFGTVHWTLSDENADDPAKLLADTYLTILHEVHDPLISVVAAKAALADWLGRQVSYVAVMSSKKATRKRLRLRGDSIPASEEELRAILATFCERFEGIEKAQPRPAQTRLR